MIRFQNVTKIYSGDVVALKNISFEIEKGEFVVVAGKSGAGKTTLLKLILGQEKPTEGEVFVFGENVNEIPKSKIHFLRRRIGSVFQDYKLLDSKTIYENIAFVLNAVDAEDEEIEQSIPEVLEIVDLIDQQDKFPYQLSSGEKQRASIARALIHRPEILLADEPTGNLDSANTTEVIELFQKVNEFGTTIVLASHNKDVIKYLKTRTFLMKNGKLEKEAKKGRILI